MPSEYTETGIEKILNDFKGTAIEPPKSIEHQYMWCLKYYIDDVKTYDNDHKNKRLILPTWHSQFMKKYEENISNRKCFSERRTCHCDEKKLSREDSPK